MLCTTSGGTGFILNMPIFKIYNSIYYIMYYIMYYTWKNVFCPEHVFINKEKVMTVVVKCLHSHRYQGSDSAHRFIVT